MSLRFSENGPEFPTALVDSMMAGEVVFLCGSGISAPQLPDFKTLVDRTYERLGVEMSPSEYSAYTAGRYEETLGSLSRNLADPAAMVHTVSDLLKVPADPKLEQHQTVLRLSRDLSNRVLVVTTNFDTLLEHALPKIFSSQAIRDASFAGQALPAPGSPDFCGVVHIHGRLEDNSLELESTPLVLTSADYGDAYMRSGWASRFLFDLARCKTIVLIGYSAGDAPVRYFLNVLEADRIRFPDLKPVYALDAYEHNPAETEAAWSTVAVTPLPYCKFDPESGVPNHSPLWQDLARLADVLDRPKLSRERLARDILGQRDPSPNDGELGQLSWLFAKRGDLWPTIVEATDNPRWFDVLQDNGFWTADEAAWVIPAWTARNPENSEVFGVAAKWALKLGEPFLRNLDRRLLRSNLSPFWQKCWRLLTTSRPVLPDAFDEEAAALNQKLRSGVVLDVDLQRSVERLKPNVVLQSRSWIPDSENDGREPGQLSDIAGIGLEVADNFHVSELIGGLDALTGQSPRILELATEALRSLLQSAVELGLINGDDDATDYDVPSVEEHEQNEHHQGVIFLVRAIVNAFNKTVAINRDLARHVAFRCLEMPGRIGIRITLYALRNTEAFTSNEAIDVLLNLRDSDFWTIRRELPLVLRDRSAEAEPTRLEAIESRIRQTAARYYDRYEIQEGQVDWRTHARDAEIWLRLMMLKEAGVLSVAGADNLAAIVARQEYLDRPTEDRDFFGIYSSGVRSVAGDSAPIMEADPDERLQVAIELSQSPNLDRQLGWLSYCRTDPQGAFETLVGAELSETNLILWADLLTTLSFGEESTKQLRETLIVKSLAKLEAIEVGIDTRLARTLIDTLLLGPRRDIANVEDWCDRLWRTVCDEEQDVVYDDNLYDTAINRMPGRLAQIQLQEIDHSRETDNSDLARQLNRLEVMASHPGAAGAFSRPIFIQALPFLLAADSRFSKSELVARLSGDGDEPRALRRILVTHAGVTPEISKLVPEAVLRAVVESSSDTKDGVPIAAQILRPAVASLRNDQPERWGISEADVGRVLRQAPGKIRAGALNVLAQWLAADQEGPEKAWTAMVAPFFNRIWPVERRFVDHAHNIHLIRLIVGAGDHFPSALNLLRPHLRPFSRSASLHSLKNSSALRKFPYAVLDLLWTVLGPSDATSYELAEILDELIDVDPNIEIDRRFQFLEQKATRYR